MTEKSIDHPTPEQLTAYVVDGPTEQVRSHLAECPECARQVEELVAVRRKIELLPEQDVPREVEQHVLSHGPAHGRLSARRHLLSSSPWYRHPLVTGLWVLAVLVLVYVLITMLPL